MSPDVEELIKYNRAAAMGEMCRCGHPRIHHKLYCGSLRGIGERCLTCPYAWGLPKCVDFTPETRP